jgi:hypothetical protein
MSSPATATSLSGGIPPTAGTSSLIGIYYLYRTNMPKVFDALFRSFLTSSKDLSLIPSIPQEKALIDDINDAMNYSLPVPKSMVTLWFGGIERLLPNAFLRAYGYEIPGERYPRSATVNRTFRNTLDYIFRNIALGIVGRTSSILDFQNAGGLAENLNILKGSLLTNETNLINQIAVYFDGVYRFYLRLTDNDLLMGKLGIVASGTDQRLIAMGQKLNVMVVSNPLAYFDLAKTMREFLETVERTNWGVAEAQRLYNPPQDAFFKMLFSAYVPVWGIDYLQMATVTIRQVLAGQTSMSSATYASLQQPMR